jgi:hypothetical protein
MNGQKKAVFLDRDGVINLERGDYIKRFEDFEILNDSVRLHLLSICSNEMELLNYLIYHIYKDKDLESGKDLVWGEFGDLIFKTMKQKSGGRFCFPFKCVGGEFVFLGEKYTKKEVCYE